MNSPTRRVLGDKDANTHLQSRAYQASTIPGDLKAASNEKAMRTPGLSSSKNTPSSSQKRKIDEVEDAERVERSRPGDSQQTLALDDSESEIESQDVSMSTYQRSYETAGTSFLGSQNIVEPQFEIQQDEMSQRTLDTMNAVPLPQNTSQLPPWQPTLLTDASAGSIGLSAYFNLDDQASTQGSDGLQMLDPAVKVQVQEVHKEKEEEQKQSDDLVEKPKDRDVTLTAKNSVTSQENTLPSIIEAAKTRLQLAMYKVQTKQVHKPFSRLKHESFRSPGLISTPRLISPAQAAASLGSTSSDATITLEIYNRGLLSSRGNAEADTINARETGDESDRSQTGRLRRSESVVANSCKNSQSTNLDTQNFLSSPPLSRQPSTDSLQELLPPNNIAGSSQHDSQTSRKQTLPSSQPQQQLSSPPVSDNGRDQKASLKAQQIGQGEAATGLLQLMTGGAGLCGV